MTAKSSIPAAFLKSIRTGRIKGLLLALALIGTLLVAARSIGTSTAAASDPLTPALALAQGTINLEGTSQAVDARSAAQLLPLWELLEGLSTSGSAAPAEITAVIEEIQLNMTSAQIKAIDAMQLASGGSTGSAPSNKSSANTTSSSAAQVAGADTGQIMGDMGAGAPPDGGGGPMISGTSQSSSSSSSKSSTTAAPAAIKQVIQLLQSKVQS
jgi:hypothetical protein